MLESLVERDILITFKGTITNPESIGNLMSSEWLQPPPMLIEHNLFYPPVPLGVFIPLSGFCYGWSVTHKFSLCFSFLFIYLLFWEKKKKRKKEVFLVILVPL
jgi:hypothetical protein